MPQFSAKNETATTALCKSVCNTHKGGWIKSGQMQSGSFLPFLIASRVLSSIQCKHCVAVWLAVTMEKHQTSEKPYKINTRVIPDEFIATALCRESGLASV